MSILDISILKGSNHMLFKKSLYPLLPAKHDFGKRRNTFRKTLQLLEERNAKVLVETGTARHGLAGTKSDGASTVVFATWAQKNNAFLHSIDHDIEAIAFAKKELLNLELEDYVEFVNADSVAWLQNFDRTIDFLYLDSYDYDKKNKAEQKLCQEHHLWEFRAVQDQLTENSLVLIDDCRLPGGGKGKLVIEHMQQRNWKVIQSGYQCLLGK